MKLTKMEPRDYPMPTNQYGAATYGEWCKKEVARIGGDARYIEEFRVIEGGEMKTVPEGTENAKAWCRVDRV